MSAGRDGVRGRFVVVAALAAAVLAGGGFLERALGPRPAGAGSAPSVATGAWFCPHGGGEGWRAWVVAANPSDREAVLRVTTFGGKGATAIRERLPGGAIAYLPVPAEDKATASMMEFFGPPVAAGMVAVRPDGAGLGAEPCASRAGTGWLVPEGTSVRGQSSNLVVVNPFAEPAVIDVTLLTGDGPLRPDRVSGVVIKPRRTVAFRLNELALGEEPVIADVRASLGKVAVGGLDVVADGGLRSVLAAPEPATTWILPGAADDGTSQVTVAAAGPRRVPFLVRAQGPESQVVVLEEGEVAGQSARTSEVEAGDAGLVVEAAGRTPFVAGRRLSSGVPPPEAPRRAKGKGRQEPPPPPPESTDSAATSGVPAGAAAWLAPPPLAPEGGRAILILENAGTAEAVADIVLLAASGAPRGLDPVPVPGGVTVTVDLAEVAGEEPVAAVVRSSVPSLVVAQAGLGPHGYAVAVGTMMEPSSDPASVGI